MTRAQGFRWPGRTALVLLLLMAARLSAAETIDLNAILGAIEEPYPLRAADTSSPRDTLRTFLQNFSEGVDAWRADKPDAEIERSFLRAANTFDFSALPELQRVAAMAVKMALLREILDRVELPPYSEIPGDEDVKADAITRWVIPNTTIEIVKIGDGPKAGQFLFSKQTVAGLEASYRQAENLPYKKGAIVHVYSELRASPGSWLPRSIRDHLPRWATRVVLGPGIWQWLALAILLGATALAFRILSRLAIRWDLQQRSGRASRRLGSPVALLVASGLAHLVYLVAFNVIGLFEFPLTLVSYLMLAIQVGSLAWFTIIISGRLADAVAERSEKEPEKQHFDAALMRILFRLASIVILVFIGIYAAEFVGIPIAPLIAGLGVGGLAIALAIRPTLENVIGGLTLFADRPVRVGDFCGYGGNVGTVEQIGLRSTRIRSLERTLITVPNSEFAQMQIDNFAARDQRLFKTVLQLRYETTPDQLRYVLAALRKMLLGHPLVTAAPARVRFVGYGASSLDLEVFAYLRCQDQGTFLAVQEDILLRIADIVSEAGTGFAYPSQTVYYRRDSGLDTERGDEAEKAIKHWREQGQLPFPDFDPGLRWEMEDILDYPPKGTYGYKPREGISEDDTPGAPTAPVVPAAAPSPAPAAEPPHTPTPPAGTASPKARPHGLARLRRWLGRSGEAR
jgi:MscS family membrane protein